ncbi:MAG: hypothetical protein Aurels2KO_45010 [Aureliella sp.]
MNTPNAPSKILLDEYFAAQDERFLEELAKFIRYDFLRTFVEKWIADPRPWAAEKITDYLRSELNLPGHEVVLKRLFKHFEATRNHSVMSEFLCTLDRLVRRRVVQSWAYDSSSRQYRKSAKLFAAPNKSVIPRQATMEKVRDPLTRRTATVWTSRVVNSATNRLFTQRTRSYLRRRAWRYFRGLAQESPEEYRLAICHALGLYQDTDFAKGENILDNWSLLHACYFHHPSLEFGTSHARLAPGKTLSDLSAAPYKVQLWEEANALEPLVELLQTAQSALIRIWAMDVLRQHHMHSLASVSIDLLMGLLRHSDVRTHEFAAELFRSHPELTELPIETWLRLLDQADPTVLYVICDALRTHVNSARLSTEQIVKLAISQPTPVATLGFELLKVRQQDAQVDLNELVGLAEPQCESVARELAAWTVQIASGVGEVDRETATTFLDSSKVAVRTPWLEWMANEQSARRADPALWSRLLESPYDDVLFAVVKSLETMNRDGGTAAGLQRVWTTVLLNISRGNRVKTKAIRQLTEAIGKDHAQADSLLPVVAFAVRSIRPTEHRSALAAVATLAGDDPSLRQQIREHLPELSWVGGSA